MSVGPFEKSPTTQKSLKMPCIEGIPHDIHIHIEVILHDIATYAYGSDPSGFRDSNDHHQAWSLELVQMQV